MFNIFSQNAHISFTFTEFTNPNNWVTDPQCDTGENCSLDTYTGGRQNNKKNAPLMAYVKTNEVLLLPHGHIQVQNNVLNIQDLDFFTV